MRFVTELLVLGAGHFVFIQEKRLYGDAVPSVSSVPIQNSPPGM
jgi:hypothetical protein